MSKPALALCGIPKLATRDGWAGANARIYIPFLGYWFANGQTISDGAGTIPQDKSLTFAGTSKPDNYLKSAGVCFQ